MSCELWLIRHGETAWTLSGAHTSRTDLRLTAGGERQAEDVKRLLNGRPFARVLASPMRRALETARLAGYAPEATADLHEWDYGAYEGRTTEDIQKDAPGWTIWTGTPPQGETIAQVSARAERMIALATTAHGDVAFFGHGHMLRVLAARWLDLDAQDGKLFALSPGSVSVLGHEHVTRVIRLWNQTAD
jgi:broad specificity phosphatase PhoE